MKVEVKTVNITLTVDELSIITSALGVTDTPYELYKKFADLRSALMLSEINYET